MSKDIAPYGWYLGTYLVRFIDTNEALNNDPEERFGSWENTVIVKADRLEMAFEKVKKIGMESAMSHEEIQTFEYVGIIDLLPIYEELEDGAEIM